MSKVELTKEQANAIEVLKSSPLDHWGYIAERMMEKSFSHDYEPFNHMFLDDVVKAYYEGYEIEQPKFEVGHIAVGLDTGHLYKILKLETMDTAVVVRLKDDEKTTLWLPKARHATKEEIFWSELGREIGDIKFNDTLMLNNGEVHRLVVTSQLEEFKKMMSAGDFLGFYPAESFKIFPEEGNTK